MDKWKNGDHEDVPLSVIRLDDLIFLAHPAELFCEYQPDMKKRLGPKTVGVELTNGGICYVGTKQAFLHRTVHGHKEGGYGAGTGHLLTFPALCDNLILYIEMIKESAS
ncbi:MAG: hypothetical protein IJU49_01300 [Lachnospiraceae bacterium]|nr:hypothetical protein [Lachnospiraceae bacterium]